MNVRPLVPQTSALPGCATPRLKCLEQTEMPSRMIPASIFKMPASATAFTVCVTALGHQLRALVYRPEPAIKERTLIGSPGSAGFEGQADPAHPAEPALAGPRDSSLITRAHGFGPARRSCEQLGEQEVVHGRQRQGTADMVADSVGCLQVGRIAGATFGARRHVVQGSRVRVG